MEWLAGMSRKPLTILGSQFGKQSPASHIYPCMFEAGEIPLPLPMHLRMAVARIRLRSGMMDVSPSI
jgi:hypothetical protein